MSAGLESARGGLPPPELSSQGAVGPGPLQPVLAASDPPEGTPTEPGHPSVLGPLEAHALPVSLRYYLSINLDLLAVKRHGKQWEGTNANSSYRRKITKRESGREGRGWWWQGDDTDGVHPSLGDRFFTLSSGLNIP